MPVEPPIKPTTPQPETPAPSQPAQPAAPPPETQPMAPDIDVPSPGTVPEVSPGQPMA
jgi:hypothetical protein